MTIRTPCRCYMFNMEKIGLTASEEKSFENVDEQTDERTTDRGHMLVYTISSHMILSFGFEGWSWVLIASVPDQFLIFAYFLLSYEPSAQVTKINYGC